MQDGLHPFNGLMLGQATLVKYSPPSFEANHSPTVGLLRFIRGKLEKWPNDLI